MATKVVYKPDSQSTDEFVLFVHLEEYKKWKAGDTTIPLADVVQSFDVFHSGQGPQGLQGKPSRQQLDTVFGTDKDVDVVKIILEKGREQSSSAISSSTYTTNPTKGSTVVDTRGKGLRGI